MKTCNKMVVFLFAVITVAGCASTNVTQQTPMSNPGLARPNQIWVYDFVAAPSDMPADSSLAGQVGAPSTPATSEEIETGRKYGAMIAQQLVKDIQAMGMPAIEAGPGSSPQIGDGVVRGYIVSTEGGGAGGMVKRMVIGFGAGTAEMDTVVEGYVMTPQGLRKLGSRTLTSSGNKTPGLVVPAAVAIAAANPVGLILVGGVKIYGAASGKTGLEARAKSTADEIAEQLRIRFQDRAGSSERRRWTEDSVTYCASRHCGGGTSRPLAEQSTRSNEVYMCSAREASRRVHVRQIGPPTILVRKPRRRSRLTACM